MGSELRNAKSLNIQIMRFNTRICKYAVYAVYAVLAAFTASTVFSCEDDNVGEFRLTGDIRHLIPDSSYGLQKTVTSDGQYIVFTPKLNPGFETWGLALAQVEYYIDDALYMTEKTAPYEAFINKDDIGNGDHQIRARMTVTGESCYDVILEKEEKFNLSGDDAASKVHGDFYINYNYVTTGDELIITPELLVNRSSEGCTIDEVKYYWDKTLVSTVKSYPYSLKYKVNAAANSSHQIEVEISYHDNSSAFLTYRYIFTGYNVLGADDDRASWDIKSKRNDYTNGETVSLTAKSFKGANVTKNHEIEFYLDDKLIGKSSSFPYTLDYTLKNLKRGTHVIRGHISTKDGDSSSRLRY